MNRQPAKKFPHGTNPAAHAAGICIFLLLLTFLVFGQTVRHDFVNIDDDLIVFENPHIAGGLDWQSVVWVFTHFDSNFYTPLRAVTHMIDCQFFGLWAGGHHLTNVLLHALSAMLLFLVLRQMTGAMWRSAFVAALFAVHPLHVESVAWISERKDTLSGLFFMLTLGAYVRYARNPRSVAAYLAVVLFFLAGLLSKPTLVTLPFVLLLLDYWPLGRFQTPGLQNNRFPIPKHLIVEKIPLFLLSAAACVVAVFAEDRAVTSLAAFPLPLRMENAVVSYALYIGQMIEPVNLSVFYVYPARGIPEWQAALAFILLVSVTAGVWALRKSRPYLATGWFWYLGMLVPVSGIVQVGIFAHADRCTYLPQIGLYIFVIWALADVGVKWPRSRTVLCGLMALVIAEFALTSWVQTSHWESSEMLWDHALYCDPGNYVAHNSLGDALLVEGKTAEAFAQFQKAVELRPGYADARNNLGSVLFRDGRVDEALAQFQEAVELNPYSAAIHNSLGNALSKKGHSREAAAQYEKALALKPHLFSALNNLAWMLATAPDASLRNGPRAVALAREAVRLTNSANPMELATLAAAFAEAGQFPEAVETAQKSLQMVSAQSNGALAAKLQTQINLYEKHTPFRDTSQSP